MVSRLHNAWAILAAVWLSIVPAHAHADRPAQVRATTSSRTLHFSQTAPILRTSAAGCASPYTVRKGDTLANIARRCGVSVTSLKKWNRLSGDVIQVGQALVIRAPRTKSPKAAATPVPGGIVPASTPSIESTVSPW